MKTEKTRLPASLPMDPGITIHNRLHRGHRYQAAVEDIVRVALRDTPGPWDVSVSPLGRAWFVIDVVAPDAASWSMQVPIHGGPQPEDLAETIRAACLRRHHHLTQRSPTASSPRAGAASMPSAAAPGGKPK
jgi:hypothetical protein